MKEYKDAKENLEKEASKVREAAKAAFKAGAMELFEQHPDLKSFGWKQATPYFNDGDECVFSAYTDAPDINGENGEDLDDGKEYDPKTGKYEQVREPTVAYKLRDPVSDFLSQFDNDTMKGMFGDHASVTVFRKGEIEIEEYYHD